MAPQRRSAPDRVIVLGGQAEGEVIAKSLVEAGYLVRAFSDLIAALETVRAAGAHAILITFPFSCEPTLSAVLERLRTDPATAAVPVIAHVELPSIESPASLGEPQVRRLPLSFTSTQLLAAVGDATRRENRKSRRAWVAGDGIRVQFAHIVGRLVNISTTGALVEADDLPPVGGKSLIALRLAQQDIEVGARVVRTEVAPPSPAAVLNQPSYRVGVTFTEVNPDAERAIMELCDEVLRREG